MKATDAKNKALEKRIATLHTDAEVERLAREQYNLVRPNEEVFDVVVPAPPSPAAPPTPPPPEPDPGWARQLMTRLTDIF
jgi:hypothetical protein